MDRQFNDQFLRKCQLNAFSTGNHRACNLAQISVGDFANINNNVRAWPIHFVILAFCDNNVGDLSFFSLFSEQSLFRIQTRHFWSFLLRLVVALTKSAPAFLLIKSI